MKPVAVFLLSISIFFSCKDAPVKQEANPAPAIDSIKDSPEDSSFFKVTEYLQGQINELKSGGINPLKFTTYAGNTDSAWLKMEKLEKEFADFLQPEIGETNLSGLFSEKRFLDQTLDAVTLTFDPIGPLPDSLTLRHWDVYIDPASGLVRRVYLLKQLPNGKTQQLTWNSGKYCKIITIAVDTNGKPSVEKEVLIKWDF